MITSMIMIILNRYELPDNTQLAIVTFNNESRVEHQLATLTRFGMKRMMMRMIMRMMMMMMMMMRMRMMTIINPQRNSS